MNAIAQYLELYDKLGLGGGSGMPFNPQFSDPNSGNRRRMWAEERMGKDQQQGMLRESVEMQRQKHQMEMRERERAMQPAPDNFFAQLLQQAKPQEQYDDEGMPVGRNYSRNADNAAARRMPMQPNPANFFAMLRGR